jgi:AcrR family transcriptional regulator
MAYRKTEAVREQLADKRLRILNAARRLIAEGGFHEAPVAAVAALAGVATGTVYRYFPSKAELFADVVGQTSRRELEIVAGIIVADGTPTQRLTGAIRAFASRALRGRRLAYALIAEPVDPEVDATRLKYRRALGRVFETIIEQGIRAGEFPPQNLNVSAAALVGACMESLVGPLSPESVTTNDEKNALIDAIIAFSLRAVAGGRTGQIIPLRQ